MRRVATLLLAAVLIGCGSPAPIPPVEPPPPSVPSGEPTEVEGVLTGMSHQDVDRVLGATRTDMPEVSGDPDAWLWPPNRMVYFRGGRVVSAKPLVVEDVE